MNIVNLIQPIAVLITFTFFIALLMMWTRVKAMKKYKVAPEKGEEAAQLKSLLPRGTMRISDNYNHLLEQPIIFYVLCILILILNKQDEFYVYSAWSFVVIRIIHSLVQIYFINVLKRFILFLTSWIILGLMSLKLLTQIF